jgi:hypothetical protein
VACLNERPHPNGHGSGPVLYGVLMRVTTLFTILRLRSAYGERATPRSSRSSGQTSGFRANRRFAVSELKDLAREYSVFSRASVGHVEEKSRSEGFRGVEARTHPL